MSRFLRWQYTLPRLALLVVVLLAGQLILAQCVRWQVIRSGAQSVGAKVDVNDTRLSLLEGRVTLRGIAVANPQSPMRNLVEAECCQIELEPGALLHKRTVVRRGAVVGLQFGTERASSGAVAGELAGAHPQDNWLDPEAVAAARKWLVQLHCRFERDFTNELESIRLTQDLLQRWPQENKAVEDRVAAIKKRTKEFQDKVRQAQSNPLRHAEFLEHLSDEIAEIQTDVSKLSHDVESLASIDEADRRKIVAARQHDEEFLRGQLQFEPIDANVLSAYLLQEQLSGPMSDLLGWLRWIRRMVPAEKPTAIASHKRGQDVVFAGYRPTPDLLIRALDLQGSARICGQPLELSGTLTDISNAPTLHDRPMRLRMTARGSLPLELQATIDRTGTVARDQLLVDCGSIALPKLRLGGSNKLRLTLAPTTASLNISVTLEGNRISGDIQLVQKQVQITPGVGPELERLQTAAALEESLKNVESLATRVAVSGTLDQPRWRLWSNLGPAVAEAMDRAIARTAKVYARQVLAESEQHVNEQLAQLDRDVAEEQAQLMPQLSTSTETLAQLADGREAGGRLSLEYLGWRLPADSLFR